MRDRVFDGANLTIAHLTRPANGEVSSGDAVLVRSENGATMIAVVDVLGHGPAAATVATAALAFLNSVPLGRASQLLLGLHEVLHGTRGAAASICIVRGRQIDGCGVGNVEIRVLGTSLPILLTPGIVGQRLHRLREFDGRLSEGDRLICFSDGISSQVPLGELRSLSPRDACAVVMQRHRRAHDDATVVIADLGATA